MSDPAVFLYGTLRHLGLLEIVLGHVPEARVTPATLEGYDVAEVEGHGFPLILAKKGASCEGLLVQKVTETEWARLNHYELGFGYALKPVEVSGQVAMVYMPAPGLWHAGGAWSLERWSAEHWPYVQHSAKEVMHLMGRVPPEEIARRFYGVNIRAHAKQMAQASTAPTSLRSDLGASTVEVFKQTPSHFGFFQTDTYELRHPKFQGGMSAVMEREVLLSGDAALVLPYDPVHDLVMLVEQFRMAPFARGDMRPWVLEPVAGRIDAGETPEEAALRECEEETGVRPERLLQGPQYYASPGEVTSFFFTYLGLLNLSNVGQGHGGLESEQEDIRRHIITFEKAMALMESGEINVAPLAHLILWLATKRDALRSEAG